MTHPESDPSAANLPLQSNTETTSQLGGNSLALAVLAGIAALVLLPSLYADRVSSLLLQLIFLLLVVLSLRRWTVAAIYAMTACSLLLSEPAGSELPGPAGILLVFVILVLLISATRLATLRQFAGTSGLRSLAAAIAIDNQTGSKDEDKSAAAVPAVETAVVMKSVLRACASVFIRSAVILIIAAMIPVAFGRDPELARSFRLLPGGMQAAQIGLFLFTICTIVYVLAGSWEFRRLSPQAARIYLQSVFLAWLDPDLRMTARRTAAMKRKMQAKKRRPATDRPSAAESALRQPPKEPIQ